jgi:hypothetical protein
MTSLRKKMIYYEKFKRIVDSEFNFFIYLPVSKAGSDYEHTHNLFTINLRRFTLPSAFKVIKKQKVQASQINMAYWSAKTFINLKNIGNLNAYTMKYQAKWYAYGILENLKSYTKPLSLCSTTRKFFLNKMIGSPLLFHCLGLNRSFHSSAQTFIKRGCERMGELLLDSGSESGSESESIPKKSKSNPEEGKDDGCYVVALTIIAEI